MANSEWKKYPDLSDNLEYLLEMGVKPGQIGLLYVNFVISDPIGHIASENVQKFTGTTRAANQKKREFQEKLRAYVSNIKNALKYEGRLVREVLPSEDRVVSETRIAVPNAGLESVLKQYVAHKDGLEKIGSLVLSGARAYARRQIQTNGPPKLFLEFNRIYNALNSIKH